MEDAEKAWPFVVTRNRVLDWRPIIAPQFMVKQGGFHLLSYETANDEDDSPTAPDVRVVSTERFGDLTLVFTVNPATRRLLGEASEQALVDRGGRHIHVTSGLVLTGSHRGAASRWQDRLSEVEKMAAEAFPRFWVAEDEATAPISSQPLISRMAGPTAPQTPAPLPKPEGVFSTTRGRALPLIGAATFFFIVVYFLIRVRR